MRFVAREKPGELVQGDASPQIALGFVGCGPLFGSPE
jgi:hypothetical protein